MVDGIPGFEIVQELGEKRGFQVYLARGPEGQQAFLSVQDRDAWDAQSIIQLKRDIERLKALSHDRLLSYLDSGDDGGSLWYALSAPGGHTLAGHFEEGLSGEHGPPVPEVLAIVRGVGEALRYLHEQDVVHGDLDPINVFLPSGEAPLLGEFYVGRPRSGGAAPLPRLRYASPEQVQGDVMDARSDVYQVGMILYHALVGKVPQEDENPFQTMLRRQQEPVRSPQKWTPGIPDGLDAVIMKCLQFEPEARYADMGEFLQDLDALDPRTGAVRAGESTPGLVPEKEADPFAGLYIPGEGKSGGGKPGRARGASYVGVLAGVAAVLALLAALLLWR